LKALREFWEGFSEVVPVRMVDARQLGEVVGVAVILLAIVAFVAGLGIFIRWMAA
jgi:hypothetical protein